MRGQEMRVCERYRLGVRVRLRAAAKALVHVGQGGGEEGAFAACPVGRLRGPGAWAVRGRDAFVRG